jgi:anti-sigma factor RsiW
MMRCAHDQTVLTAYLLGELRTDEQLRIEQRIQGCPACLAQCERLKPVVAVLREQVERSPVPKIDVAFVQDVQNRLRQDQIPFRSWYALGFRLQWGAALAGVVVLVLMIHFSPVARGPQLVENPVVIHRAAASSPVWQLSRPALAEIRSVFFPSIQRISLSKPRLTMPQFPQSPQWEGWYFHPDFRYHGLARVGLHPILWAGRWK